MKRVLFILGCLFIGAQAFAQTNLHFSANLTNNHLWRGSEVSSGFVLEADANVGFFNDHFNLGLWGGFNTIRGNGNYKEFDYYAKFQHSGFSVALWDIFNYSDEATYDNKDFFNYDPHTTGRFLDLTVGYNFGHAFPKVPLSLSWSTVIFGRDRGLTREHNIYSTYVYGEYRFWQNQDWAIDGGIGVNFALNNEDNTHTNFFGDHYGINTVSLKVTRQVKIGSWHFPVYANAYFNPQAKKAFYQIGATVLSF